MYLISVMTVYCGYLHNGHDSCIFTSLLAIKLTTHIEVGHQTSKIKKVAN